MQRKAATCAVAPFCAGSSLFGCCIIPFIGICTAGKNPDGAMPATFKPRLPQASTTMCA